MNAGIDYEKVAPDGYKALGGVYAYIKQAGLADVLVELVVLRVSQINGCAYCHDLHTRGFVKKGVLPEKLALVQVWHEAGLMFDDRKRAALRWAETVTHVAATAILDNEFQAVSAVFGEKDRGPDHCDRPEEYIQSYRDRLQSPPTDRIGWRPRLGICLYQSE